MTDQELELLLEIAQKYYEKDMTQQEIADCLFMSRSKVSRLLRQAKEKNIVEVYIHYPYKRHQVVEEELKRRFNLDKVLISDSEGKIGREIYAALSMMAANYVSQLLCPNISVGITWGNTVHRVISEMRPPHPINDMTVVTLAGFRYTANKVAVDGGNLARDMAERHGCQYRQITAPLILDSPEVRDSLLHMPVIKDTLLLANHVDMFFTNVGLLGNWEDSLSAEELREMKNQGVVGSVCGHFFDKSGRFVPVELQRRTIAASADVFTKARYRIAVCSDLYKAPALLAAMQGQLFNILIIDTKVAYRILSLADNPK